MNGILPLWKPRGYTSHDCVMRVRRLYKMKKVGHTGTLDPEAVGVLPICLGEATKIVPFLVNTEKVYIAELSLGSSTDTEDAQGKIVETKEVINQPNDLEIDEVLKTFTGTIEQVPPMYSAVKVNGKKLYEYARENKEVERPIRTVTIHKLERISSINDKANHFKLKIICSKGTYIRTLCVDIGKALGFPAHMSDLTRIKTGEFTAEKSFTLEEIENTEKNEPIESLEKYLSSLEKGITHLYKHEVDENTKIRVSYGQKLPRPKEFPEMEPVVITYKGQLLAIYQVHPENELEIKPVRVFNKE